MEEQSDLTSQQLEAEVAVVAEEAAEAVASVVAEVVVEAVASVVAEVVVEVAEVAVIEEEEAEASHLDQEWLSVKETPNNYEHEKHG